MKNIMVIINPKSGKSEGESLKDIIKEDLKHIFEQIDIEITKEAGDGTKLAKKACDEGYHSVCSVGGDGTLAEVLTGLIDAKEPPKLLIFPAGTGNIMSKSLDIEQKKEEALKNIDFENPKFIDIGIANGKCFSFMLSIGQLPESLHEVENEEKDKLGMLAYVRSAIKNLSKDIDYNLEVEVDGEIYNGTVDHLFITLSEKYGTIKIPSIESTNDDGNLNVLILKNKSIFTKAKIGYEILVGDKFNEEDIKIMQGKSVKIKNLANNEVVIDLDGDKGPKLPIEAKVINSKVKVYVPFKIENK